MGRRRRPAAVWALADGKSICEVAGGPLDCTSNAASAATPDIETVRVHYKRFDGQYSNWGVHIWDGGGLGCVASEGRHYLDGRDRSRRRRSPTSTTTPPAVARSLSIPVLNTVANPAPHQPAVHHPRQAAGGDADDKDGRNDNISISYAAWKIAGKVGEVLDDRRRHRLHAALPETRGWRPPPTHAPSGSTSR